MKKPFRETVIELSDKLQLSALEFLRDNMDEEESNASQFFNLIMSAFISGMHNTFRCIDDEGQKDVSNQIKELIKNIMEVIHKNDGTFEQFKISKRETND